jgi:hypothetical protein
MGPSVATATDWTAITAWAAVAVYVVLGVFAWIQVLQAGKKPRGPLARQRPAR